MGYIIIKWI